ncbi:MAG: hypothetical protein FJ299_15305 [Planctomycetes bacterium]|nr:hypothetical protein [Planctomycetota bacterium]
MSRRVLWYVGKGLEFVGMIVVLAGVLISINEGLIQQNSLASMRYEFIGLGVGGGLFVVGWLLERAAGGR